MTQDDLLYRFRLRVFAMAAELGNVRAACRAMGIHPSDLLPLEAPAGPARPGDPAAAGAAGCRGWPTPTSVRWSSSGWSPSPSAIPGFGPARIAAELARPKWGGIVLSANGVWRVLRRHGLATRARALWAGRRLCRPTGSRSGRTPPPERHLQVDHPGAAGPAGLLLHRPASAAPRAPSGNTPPSTSPRPTPGRPSRCRPP